MTVRHLDKLLRPTSVAVIGATDRPQSVGAVVMRNLLSDGFAGPVWPVNPKHREVAGVKAHRDVASLPDAPDLGVICTPPATVPGLIADLGARGGRAAGPRGRPPMNPNDPSTWGKVSRNAPCPCGSGKKYKHCHGRG